MTHNCKTCGKKIFVGFLEECSDCSFKRDQKQVKKYFRDYEFNFNRVCDEIKKRLEEGK